MTGLRQPPQRNPRPSSVSSVVFEENASVREAETIRSRSDKHNPPKHADKRQKASVSGLRESWSVRQSKVCVRAV